MSAIINSNVFKRALSPLRVSHPNKGKEGSRINLKNEFVKVAVSFRKAIEDLNISKEVCDVDYNNGSIRILFKKASTKITLLDKLEARVFQMSFDPDAENKKTSIKYGKGNSVDLLTFNAKTDVDEKGDFLTSELESFLLNFFSKYKEDAINWQADFLNEKYDYASPGSRLLSDVKRGLLQSEAIPNGEHSRDYFRANSAIVRLLKPKPVDGDIKLEIDGQTPEESYAEYLKELKREEREKAEAAVKEAAGKLKDFGSLDKPPVEIKKNPPVIKSPNVVSIRYRDEFDASREFLENVDFYGDDLTQFFKGLDAGISHTITHQEEELDGRFLPAEVITLFPSSYSGEISQRPEASLMIMQDFSPDRHPITRLKYFSKNLLKISLGSDNEKAPVDADGNHIIGRETIQGSITLQQVDMDLFKLLKEFGRGIFHKG